MEPNWYGHGHIVDCNNIDYASRMAIMLNERFPNYWSSGMIHGDNISVDDNEIVFGRKPNITVKEFVNKYQSTTHMESQSLKDARQTIRDRSRKKKLRDMANEMNVSESMIKSNFRNGLFAVRCETQKIASKFCASINNIVGESYSWKHSNGIIQDLTNNTYWNEYKRETCYMIEGGKFKLAITPFCDDKKIYTISAKEFFNIIKYIDVNGNQDRKGNNSKRPHESESGGTARSLNREERRRLISSTPKVYMGQAERAKKTQARRRG